jgi:LacI family transcriptional regulator
MPVTIRDVAREAGVTVSTVSRSLNGAYGVNQTTREKVVAIARRLNYSPNRVARGLVTGQTQTLALIISDIRNPFFAEVARGAQDCANRAGFDLVLCNADLEPAAQMRYVRSMLAKRVDGLIMNSVMLFSREERDELAASGIPVVLLNRPRQTKAFSIICADNVQGGKLAGAYLRKLGHRKIAHLTGPKQHGNLTDRSDGFLSACADGIVIHGEQTFRGGCAMARQLFDEHPDVTAVFAASDAIAFGVIREAWNRGLRVPADLSVIGFDNVEVSGIIHPPLTTVHQPKYEMGEAAVEILIKHARQIAGGATPMPEHRILGVQLIERESCRAV